MTADAILFDLGNVLVKWNPRNLYRKVFASADEMERFLAEVCTAEWNEQQDAGRAIAEANALLIARHPHYKVEIEAYYGRFDEMIAGEMEGMAALVADLKARGVPLYGLSNWCAETFHHGLRYSVLRELKDIVVSGRERVKKPDPRIFQIAVDRFGLVPERTLFIDDVAANITAGEAVGLKGHLFTGADELRSTLKSLGLL
jgi:2-haloacid dehalogenase